MDLKLYVKVRMGPEFVLTEGMVDEDLKIERVKIERKGGL